MSNNKFNQPNQFNNYDPSRSFGSHFQKGPGFSAQEPSRQTHPANFGMGNLSHSRNGKGAARQDIGSYPPQAHQDRFRGREDGCFAPQGGSLTGNPGRFSNFSGNPLPEDGYWLHQDQLNRAGFDGRKGNFGPQDRPGFGSRGFSQFQGQDSWGQQNKQMGMGMNTRHPQNNKLSQNAQFTKGFGETGLGLVGQNSAADRNNRRVNSELLDNALTNKPADKTETPNQTSKPKKKKKLKMTFKKIKKKKSGAVDQQEFSAKQAKLSDMMLPPKASLPDMSGSAALFQKQKRPVEMMTENAVTDAIRELETGLATDQLKKDAKADKKKKKVLPFAGIKKKKKKTTKTSGANNKHREALIKDTPKDAKPPKASLYSRLDPFAIGGMFQSPDPAQMFPQPDGLKDAPKPKRVEGLDAGFLQQQGLLMNHLTEQKQPPKQAVQSAEVKERPLFSHPKAPTHQKENIKSKRTNNKNQKREGGRNSNRGCLILFGEGNQPMRVYQGPAKAPQEGIQDQLPGKGLQKQLNPVAQQQPLNVGEAQAGPAQQLQINHPPKGGLDSVRLETPDAARHPATNPERPTQELTDKEKEKEEANKQMAARHRMTKKKAEKFNSRLETELRKGYEKHESLKQRFATFEDLLNFEGRLELCKFLEISWFDGTTDKHASYSSVIGKQSVTKVHQRHGQDNDELLKCNRGTIIRRI